MIIMHCSYAGSIKTDGIFAVAFCLCLLQVDETSGSEHIVMHQQAIRCSDSSHFEPVSAQLSKLSEESGITSLLRLLTPT